MNKIALLIVDMQRDFVEADGALSVAGAAATVPAVARLLEHARREGWLVVHVIRLHDPEGRNADMTRRHLFTDGGKGYCVEGTRGAEIVDELTPIDGEETVVKTRNSGFLHTRLEGLLRSRGVARVVVAGTQYPNCVRATANDAMSLDFDAIVATDACSAQTPEIAAANITDLRNMGIRCQSVSEIINARRDWS